MDIGASSDADRAAKRKRDRLRVGRAFSCPARLRQFDRTGSSAMVISTSSPIVFDPSRTWFQQMP
jgi:hypothetical protein